MNKNKQTYKFSRGEEGHIVFDLNGYVIEAKGFGFLIWSSSLSIDKDIIGKHVDEVAEFLKKNGKSKEEYLKFETYVHLELLKEMLKNSKK